MANPASTREQLYDAVQGTLELKSKAAAKRTVDAVFEAMAKQVAENGTDTDYTLTIPALGTFSVEDIPAGTSRNPRTGEATPRPARTKIKLKLAKALRDIGK